MELWKHRKHNEFFPIICAVYLVLCYHVVSSLLETVISETSAPGNALVSFLKQPPVAGMQIAGIRFPSQSIPGRITPFITPLRAVDWQSACPIPVGIGLFPPNARQHGNDIV